METTVDINALRDGIIRDLKETKSLGMLEWIREMMDRVKETEKEENLEPYTMEELNARIDRAEAEEENGIPGMEWQDFAEEIRKKMDSHESLRPYTAEELRVRVRRAEAEDPEGTDWDDFEKELKQELPWLRV